MSHNIDSKTIVGIETKEKLSDNPIDNKDVFEVVANAIRDKKLSEKERKKIKNFISQKYKEKKELNKEKDKSSELIIQETKEATNEIFNEIKSLDDLKNLIKESNIYKEADKEIKGLSYKEIKNIQRLVGSYQDGIFGVNTFIAYKNSRLGKNFSLTEIAKGKDILSENKVYQEALEQAKELKPNQIKNIQRVIGSGVDGIFGPDTFLNFKNSDLSENFSIAELGKGKKVGNNIEQFIENFSKMQDNNKDEMTALLEGNIKPDDFVFIDENGNINITKEEGGDILVNSITPSDELTIHTAFEKNNKAIFLNRLNILANKEDKINFLNKTRRVIEMYNLQNEARRMFIKNDNGNIKIDLPNELMKEIFEVKDLFGDLKKFEIEGEIFENNGEGKFLNKEGVELNLKDFELHPVKNEEINSKIEEVKKKRLEEEKKLKEANEKNLSKEFGDWLAKHGRKNLIGGKGGRCGLGSWTLIQKFLEYKGLKGGIKLRSQRHGTNFDNFLIGEVSKDNPFILSNGRGGITKVRSKEALKRSGIDIEKMLSSRIKVTKRKTDFPNQAKPGEIIVFNSGPGSNKARRNYGHVEIVGNDGMFYSDKAYNNAGGSTRKVPQKGDPKTYQKRTGFTGYAYSLNLS